MRVNFIAAYLTLILLATASVASAEADKNGVSNALRSAEARGLSAVPKVQLASMVVEPETSGDVAYSRSWLRAQPKASGNAAWKCLTQALYFEARGETVKGQFAVAEVILNRVKSTRFPDNICGVIHQGTGRKYQCQFTYTCDGAPEVISEPEAYAQVGKVARAVIDGRAPALTSGATHYHTTAVRPKWSRVYTKTAAIGVHLFYRHTYRSASN